MSPKLLAGRKRIRTPRDIFKFPLIHIGDRQNWASWLEAVGVGEVAISQGPVLNRDSMAIDASIDGQGIVLTRATLASWDLLNGRFVIPVAASIELQKTYWIVATKAASKLSKVVTFRSWLLREVAADERRLRKLLPPRSS
jgi:LysR family glycine cleavage system transcriptional activator